MKKDYLIKKDLSDYKLEAQKIYQSNFGGNQVEAENIFNNIIMNTNNVISRTILILFCFIF